MAMECQILATAKVELLLTEKPQENERIKQICGVVCFIKDHSKRKYFIQIFNVNERKLEWEQELRPEFVYKTPRPLFHTFEAEGNIFGFTFADDEEAKKFLAAIQKKQSAYHQNTPKKCNGNGKIKKFTKADISRPTDFQHISHVGWDPVKGLDTFLFDTQDEIINNLFKMAGLSDKQLEDEDTRAFICDFIDRQGFRETLQNLQTEKSNKIINISQL